VAGVAGVADEVMVAAAAAVIVAEEEEDALVTGAFVVADVAYAPCVGPS
jgi:hypothetical protein